MNPPARFVFVSLVLLLPLLGSCGGDKTQESDTTGPRGDTTPPASVTDLRTSSPTFRSINLTWTVPGDDGMTGTASAYEFRYSTAPITEDTWSAATMVDGEPVPVEVGGLQSFRVLDLESAKDYHFAMKATDEVPNESGLSNSASGTTAQETTPPSTITDLLAEAAGETSFILRWTAPGDDDGIGTASEYDLRYSTSRYLPTTAWDISNRVTGEPVPSESGQPESFTVTGLEAGKNYFFAMMTADEVPNWSDISNAAPALGQNVFLWTYPNTVKDGNLLKILYEAGPDSTAVTASVRNSLYTWVELLPPDHYQSGFYSSTWDFRNENGNLFGIDPYAYYTIRVYWNSEIKAESTVWLEE